MALTPQQATQIAQLLGQYHDVAAFVVEAGQTPNQTAAQILARTKATGNPLAGAAYGMAALTFVYTFDAVVKEQNYPTAIVNCVNLGVLGIVLNTQGANETPEQACLRHLRNCFAHGRFTIQVVNPQSSMITLHDENNQGVATFDARCDAVHVIDLAEHLLIAAHDVAYAVANPPPPVVAAAPAAPPAAATPPPGPPVNQGGGTP